MGCRFVWFGRETEEERGGDRFGRGLVWQRAGVLFGRLRGRRKPKGKAGIREKEVLVLWSGVCGSVLIAGKKMQGSSGLFGWRQRKESEVFW